MCAIALHGLADSQLEKEVEAFAWLHLGQVEVLLRTLHERGVREVVLAGKVPKARLLADPQALRLDARALAFLSGLEDRRDDAILGAVADLLEAEGVRVRSQAELVPELVAPEGALGARAPTPEELADVAFGWPLAKQVGALDIGQTIVVRDRAVLAVEAIEGTDEAILRGGRLGGPGACVVKVMRPDQDPRFDLPSVGPGTIGTLVEARARMLAVEAGCTLLIEREELLRQADAHGICLLGVSGAGLAPEAGA